MREAKGNETAIPGRFIAAPMAELSHAGFRSWCEGYGGADLYYGEMMGVRALIYGSAHLSWYADSRPVPEKTIIQLWGVHPEDFAKALPKLRDFPVPGVDVNMGCCAPLIRSKGGGIALMSAPDAAARIVGILSEGLPGKTVSAKIRVGEREDEAAMVDFARRLEDAGAAWIALNPRIRRDKHHRPAKWNYVRILKESLGIPVVGNGDIVDWESFRKRRDDSGADAFMIGRAGIRFPWLFDHLRKMESRELVGSTSEGRRIDRLEMVRSALDGIEEWQPPEFHLPRAKRFLSLWMSQLAFGNRLFESLRREESLDAIRDGLEGYFHRNPAERLLEI